MSNTDLTANCKHPAPDFTEGVPIPDPTASSGLPPTVAIINRLIDQLALLLSLEEFEKALQLAQSAVAANLQSADLFNLAAICAIRNGDPGQAEQYWRQAIALAPQSAEAYSNLAVLLAGQRRDDEAERCHRQAIALEPASAGTHFNLGIFFSNRGRLREAEEYYRQAIALEPANADAHGNLAVLLATQKRDGEAEQCYRLTLSLNPSDLETWSNLGILLASQKRDDEAERCYRQAISLDPGAAKAYSNLGILLARQRRIGEAEQCYRQAIALEPSIREAHSNLGLLLGSLARDDEAEQCFLTALAVNPDAAETHSNLGNLLAKLQRHDEAEHCYRQAIALNPGAAAAHSNLGVLLTDCRRQPEAESCFRQAIALDAHYPLARHNLAMLLLSQGRLAEGWRLHEARYDPALPEPDAPLPDLPGTQWQGEPLAGKSLLVWPEQGLGDMIQFCRYLSLAKQQGASHITLVCRPELKCLMTTLAGVDTVLALGEALALPAHDYWTLPMSLPPHFNTELATIPAPLPYLHALPERIALWSSLLPALTSENFKIGLVWQGNPMHANDRHRSLPGLSAFEPLLSIPGTHFVSLQTGSNALMSAAASAPNLTHVGDRIGDFADTAAIIHLLDLVICVDTAVAHLAGALGKACWVLLPAHKTDWRWMTERTDSPWYPVVMRLFRQQEIGDWDAAVMQMNQALKHLTARSE